MKKNGGVFLLAFFVASRLWAQGSTATPSSTNSLNTTVTAPAPEASSTKYTATLGVTTLGRSVKDDNLKSTVGWSFVEAGFTADYFEWMSFGATVVGVFGEGAAQNYLGGEGGGTSALVIDSAGLEIKPVKELALKAGIIGYRINPIMTTMTPGTTVGTEQKLTLENNKKTMKLTLTGNEAIPSVGVNKSALTEGTSPFFIAGSIQADGKIEPMGTTLKLATTEFKFGNLPKSAAEGALSAGNSIHSVSGTGSDMQFVIGFAGRETAAAIETEWNNNFKTTLKGVTIKNERAFAGLNEGKMGRFDFDLKLGNFHWIPSVTAFEVQADATPAIYSIMTNRYNNRKGYSTGLRVELEKQKIAFFGSYMKAEEIQKTPFLSDREIYNLGLEVSYDLL